jgi:hypothetical protein
MKTTTYAENPSGPDDRLLWKELLGVFLVSFAVLLFQITTTKVIEYSLWANYAFLIISTAMFGIGLSGVAMTRWPGILKLDTGLFFACNALCCGVTVWLAFLGMNAIPLHLPGAPNGWGAELGNLGLLFLVLSLPYLFFGFIISGLFEKKGRRAGIYYFADLVGAGLGCLALMALIKYLAPQGLVMLSVVLAVTATPLFFSASRFAANKFALGTAWAVALVAIAGGVYLVPTVQNDIPITVHVGKRTYKQDLEAGRIEATSWSPLSRVDVAEMTDWAKRVWIAGGVNESSIIKFDGDFETLRARRPDTLKAAQKVINYQAYPHFFKKDHTVCMIGTSGGADSLYALSLGARHVVGVEMDPGVAAMVTRRYHEYAGGLFTDGKYSELVVDEGRSYLRRTDRKFDVIQQVNNFTPIAFMNGALNLSETYLLTVESFKDFYDHLNDDGILSISRYGSYKLLANGVEMFRRMGVKPEEYAKHFMIVEGPQWVIPTMLMKKSAFTREEVTAFRDWFYALGKRRQILYAPYIDTPDNFYSRIATLPDPDGMYRLGAFDLSPATDNKPFFNHVKILGLKDVDRNAVPYLPEELKHIEAYNILKNRLPPGDIPVLAVLGIAFVLASVFFGLPMLTGRELRSSLKTERRALAYFACLGMGFIFVEVCLIQRFVLFLGQPVYSISIVLCALLVSAGVGSLLSEKIQAVRGNIIALLLVLASAVLVMHFTIPLLSEGFIQYPLLVRMAIALAFISACGLLMGMPMPLAIRYLKEQGRPIIAWGWAINGYFSVIGSALTILVAVNFGFGAVFYFAALCYAVAPFFLVSRS